MGLGHPEKADRMARGSNSLGELGNASRRKDYGGGPRGEGEPSTQGKRVWRPWEAILKYAKAPSHNAIKLLLLFIPKGAF